MNPKWGGCTSLSIEEYILEPKIGWSHINIDGNIVEIFSKNIETLNCECVIICFSAAVPSRENKKPPFFSGLKISDTLNYPLIAISDPSLAMHEKISLGWYAGNFNHPYLQKTIRKFVDNITDAVTGKVIIIGGSGGGFAGLANNFFEEPSKFNTIVWNPQVSITDYYSSFVERYTKFCWDFLSSNYPLDVIGKFNNLGILHDLKNHKFKTKGKIVYLQNISDSSHYQKHCMSFVSSFNMEEKDNGDYIRVFQKGHLEVKVGDWGKGHVSPPNEILLKEIKNIL